MSKGTIVSELGAGEYLVRPRYDLSRVQEKIASLESAIDDLDSEILALQVVYDEAVDDLRVAANLLTNALNNGDADQIEQAQRVWVEKLEESQRALVPLQIAKVKRLSKQTKLKTMQDTTPDESETVTAWCADYTEGLSGDVGLIDVASGPIIQPGWNPSPTPESAYDLARDGVMLPPEGFYTGSGLYRAMALYDGWQIFRPTYRTGVITSKSGDSCSVELDDLQTRYIEADANRETGAVASADIVYMDCNGAVFGEGDHVVVAFLNQDPNSARVVGFVSDPIPCVTHGVLADYGDLDSFDRESFLYMHSNADGWIGRQYNGELNNGQMEWLGPQNGSGGYDKYLVMEGKRDRPTSFGPNLMQNGKIVATAPRPVMGGAIVTVSGTDYYVVVTLDNDDIWQATADVFLKLPVDDPMAGWQEIGQVPHSAYGLDATYHHLFPSPESTAYLFSESGTKAIKLQRVAKVVDPQHSYVDNPDWETVVPETSSPPADGGRAQHVLEVWMVRNLYEETPLKRQAFVVEVFLASDLSGLTYTIDEDVTTIAESGTRQEEWSLPPTGGPGESGSFSHSVSCQSVQFVDYIGDTRSQLTMDHTSTRTLSWTYGEDDGGVLSVLDETWTDTTSTVFRVDGTVIFSCSHDSDRVRGWGRREGDFHGEDWTKDHLLCDLLAIDLRFGAVLVRQLDLDLHEIYTVVDEGDGPGEEGTQTVSYTESIILKRLGSADQVVASETRNETVDTPFTPGGTGDGQPPFDRLQGYVGLVTGLGEVVASPGSDCWPEFAGRTGLGYAFIGNLGADTVPGGGWIFVTKTGEMFAGGTVRSRSLSADTGEIEWGEGPYPVIDVIPLSDGEIDDAYVAAQGAVISGGWLVGPNDDAVNYASIPSGWVFRGARMV